MSISLGPDKARRSIRPGLDHSSNLLQRLSATGASWTHAAIYEALEGGSQYPINHFEKISHIPNINMANIPEIQKTLYPHIPKIDPSIQYPYKDLGPYSCTHKNLPVPHLFGT